MGIQTSTWLRITLIVSMAFMKYVANDIIQGNVEENHLSIFQISITTRRIKHLICQMKHWLFLCRLYKTKNRENIKIKEAILIIKILYM